MNTGSSWSINYDDSTKILYISIEGMITQKDFFRITTESIKQQSKYNVLGILINLIATQSDMTLADIYNVPLFYEQVDHPRNIKISFLVTEDFYRADDLEFYKTTCQNLGYTIHLFTDQNTALEWLTE